MGTCTAFRLAFALLAWEAPHSAEALSTSGRLALDRVLLQDSQDVQLQKEMMQGDQTPVVVEHESWFSRLGNSFFAVLAGLFVVIPASISCLWVNERRNARLEVVLSYGKQEAETIEANQAHLLDYEGMLVHVNSESAKGLHPVQDERFSGVRMEVGCLRLKTSVEVFQWVEEEKQEKRKDNLGGGETTVKTYTYRKDWSSSKVDSDGFHDSHRYRNMVHVRDMPMGEREVVNECVIYGTHFRLPKDLVMQLNTFEDARRTVGDRVSFVNYQFTRKGDWYFCPAHGGEPEIGDVRASFRYVLDGPATVLALQMNDNAGNLTFGPYRSVSRGFFCSAREDFLKTQRVLAAQKDTNDIYEEEKCLDYGPFFCLCCFCNLVTYFFSTVLPPQIYSAWPGQRSKTECFESVSSAAIASKWTIRFVGWVLLWVGFMMLFQPLSTVADIIPWLGKYISSGISGIVGVVTFVFTLAVAAIIVSLAYMLYHPLIGILYLAIAGGAIGLVVMLTASQSAAA